MVGYLPDADIDLRLPLPPDAAAHEGRAHGIAVASPAAVAKVPGVGSRPRRPGGGVPWPEARARAGTSAVPLEARLLPLQAACGCLLAADLVALTDLPVTDNSAMDGWAVAGSPPWRVIADLPAGRLLERPLDRSSPK